MATGESRCNEARCDEARCERRVELLEPRGVCSPTFMASSRPPRRSTLATVTLLATRVDACCGCRLVVVARRPSGSSLGAQQTAKKRASTASSSSLSTAQWPLVATSVDAPTDRETRDDAPGSQTRGRRASFPVADCFGWWATVARRRRPLSVACRTRDSIEGRFVRGRQRCFCRLVAAAASRCPPLSSPLSDGTRANCVSTTRRGGRPQIGFSSSVATDDNAAEIGEGARAAVAA